MKNTMKFITVLSTAGSRGSAENLQVTEGLIPSIGNGEVLIEVFAAGLNGADIAQRQGSYPPPPGASPILGLEVSGIIRETSPGSKWKVGERVCALVEGGGYAEFCVAAEGQCLPIPTGFSFEQAAGIPETFFTVWTNVFQQGGLKAGENFLVHGGSSGIGTTAIQLAKAFGATVFTTAGSEEKCRLCRELGADHAINYKEKDFVSEFKDIHLTLDMVGGSYTAKNIACAAPKGRIVQIAARQGKDVTIDIFKIMQKRLVLTGSTLRPRSREEKSQIGRELYEKVWPLFETGKVRVSVDRVFPMTEVSAAHTYMESSAHVGKIILKMKNAH